MAEIYSMDQELGVHVTVFFLKNVNPAPYHILTDPISNQAAGLWSCITDMDECLVYLSLLKGMLDREDIPYHAKKSLYVASVVTYIRSFNQGEGRPVQLDANQVFKNTKQRDFHQEIKNIRDKNFAHAGLGLINSQRTILYFDPENVVSGKLESKINTLQLAFGHDTDRFIELIEITILFLKSKLDKLLPVFQNSVLSMGIEELNSQPKLPDPSTFVEW